MQELNSRHIKILIFLFPIVMFLIFLVIKKVSLDTYILLVQEDAVVEYVQAFFYFLASIFSFLISIKFLKNKLTLLGVLYGILTVGLLFVSLEEISWGQRIFNIENPDYFKQHNVQDEISFHNLDTVQSSLHKIYILVGFYGAFAWLFVRQFMSMEKTKCSHIVNFVVPNWFISSYFFSVFLIYILIELHLIWWRYQEPVELLLSLGFLCFAIFNYIKLQGCLTGSTQKL